MGNRLDTKGRKILVGNKVLYWCRGFTTNGKHTNAYKIGTVTVIDCEDIYIDDKIKITPNIGVLLLSEEELKHIDIDGGVDFVFDENNRGVTLMSSKEYIEHLENISEKMGNYFKNNLIFYNDKN